MIRSVSRKSVVRLSTTRSVHTPTGSHAFECDADLRFLDLRIGGCALDSERLIVVRRLARRRHLFSENGKGSEAEGLWREVRKVSRAPIRFHKKTKTHRNFLERPVFPFRDGAPETRKNRCCALTALSSPTGYVPRWTCHDRACSAP